MRVLIVEDETLVRERLARMCRELLGPGALVTAQGSVDDASDALRARPIDLLLLDLSLHGEDGFRLLRTAVASAFHTVVVSAHTDRALEAFALGVLDFVPKPFSRERLGQALDRAREATVAGGRSVQFLGVWRPHGVALVPVDEVCWIRADGDYSELQLSNGRTALHDKSLDRLAALLPSSFVRCHRSHLVNLAYASRLVSERGSRYTLELRDGTRLPVGRSRLTAIRERFG